MFKSEKCVYKQDLLAAIVLAILATIFIIAPILNETPLRLLFALPLIFIIPGYTFISIMFPKKEEISNIERATLSVGFSIAIAVFDGYILSVTKWLFRPDSIAISLLLVTIVLVALAYISRRRYPENEQFTFSLKEFIESVKYEDDDDLEKDTISPTIKNALTIALVASIVLASGMLIYAKITQEEEVFSTLYILGPDGKAENYPINASIEEPITVIVGIENYEKKEMDYILQMRLDGEVLETVNVKLSYGQKWEGELTYHPEQIRTGRSKLEYALFKETVTTNPYRSVHLWITHGISK
ncbi:DUF1616 domain-containing protein [Methanococcoides sp. NM1]|uniref:DUF1616 domain-containing protein n=1 Tax=Methanococcoides sp. NM1 TaxID=1201013 RepID=UPI0010827E99|nr:DUF1616 domain-containing protein [Methanococcoides sp. NM1]